MSKMMIRGGVPLHGVVQVRGAKNGVTKMMLAALMTREPVVLHNVPNIADVAMTVDLCRSLGADITWDCAAGVMTLQLETLRQEFVSQRFSGANRLPILLLGALMGRGERECMVPVVGGCALGRRPVDFHLSALQAMGANVVYRALSRDGAYLVSAPQGGLRGTTIELPFPSVGATENALFAACGAAGTTTIHNAAIEPEIHDLVLMLQKMGAVIVLHADRSWVVQGGYPLKGVSHTVQGDRIIGASYAMAALGTGGEITVEGLTPQLMSHFHPVVTQLGGGYRCEGEKITYFAQGPLKGGLHIETGVYPGFATDWQQPLTVLLTQAAQPSVVHETVYEKRFGYVEMLQKMGGKVEVSSHCLGAPCRFHGHNFPHSAIIWGQSQLTGTQLHIPDLRAGFAYILAALMAEGQSTIHGLGFVQRGYEALEETLTNLGAEVQID